ncbi:MAG: hypothetical protein QG578_2053 [Thermodesulfobacteriota bacterium]|nr:hypothetical protein [Thermodesulfobacteriota bacterium]
MKKLIILIVMAIIIAAPSANAASLTADDFQYCADIQGDVRAETLYQVHLSDEILQKAGTDLRDIRILHASRNETPFVIIGNAPPHETIETYSLEITGYDNDASSASIILKLPKKHRPVSVLDLDIADRDFKKRIILDGSSDGKTWKFISEGSIYDFSSRVNVRKTKIEFASTDAQYFRATLRDYKPRQASQPSIKLTYEGLDFSVNGALNTDLRIRAAHASTGTPAEKKPVYDQKTFTPPSAEPDKDGNTVIVLPAGLPVDKLSLEIADPYFHRVVNLYGSSTGRKDSYSLLASQVIYRFPLSSERHEESNSISLHAPRQAYLKIIILNRNNPPLELKSITLSWIQQNLYFMALKSGERYALCCGNTRIKSPDYDLARFVNKEILSQHSYEQRELSALRTGKGLKPTLRERLAGMEKMILTIVILLLVTGMGWWLYALMKKKPEKK